jgi:hypothetical protein
LYGLAGVYPVGGNSPGAMAVADFNNDGNIDLATITEQDYDTTVSIVFGKGEMAHFQPHWRKTT